MSDRSLDHSTETAPGAHESVAAPAGWIFIVGLGLLGLAVLALAISWGMVSSLAERDATDNVAGVPVGPQELGRTPRLMPNQSLEYQQLKAQQLTQLSEYGWIDQERGIARIPLSRAMELIAERGLPAATPVAEESPDAPAP